MPGLHTISVFSKSGRSQSVATHLDRMTSTPNRNCPNDLHPPSPNHRTRSSAHNQQCPHTRQQDSIECPSHDRSKIMGHIQAAEILNPSIEPATHAMANVSTSDPNRHQSRTHRAQQISIQIWATATIHLAPSSSRSPTWPTSCRNPPITAPSSKAPSLDNNTPCKQRPQHPPKHRPSLNSGISFKQRPTFVFNPSRWPAAHLINDIKRRRSTEPSTNDPARKSSPKHPVNPGNPQSSQQTSSLHPTRKHDRMRSNYEI
ncbi:hypothetical protein ACLOJK_022724 [Asimina triloba]